MTDILDELQKLPSLRQFDFDSEFCKAYLYACIIYTFVQTRFKIHLSKSNYSWLLSSCKTCGAHVLSIRCAPRASNSLLFLKLIFVYRFFILLSVIALSLTANADNKKLPIPRFVSIKSNEVNARSGPTTKSAIEWVFIKKGEPVEIIAEYEQWRQVRDINGEGGWIHSSVLSGKRSVIITSDKEIELTKNENPKSRVVAKLIPKVRCTLKKCKEQFCQITCKDYTGWVSKKVIWGVYDDEKAY